MKTIGPHEPSINEETVTVKMYSWTCDICGRRFHHYHSKTLRANIPQHRLTQHGTEASNAQELERVERELARIKRRVGHLSN